jgi:hypothetical protein
MVVNFMARGISRCIRKLARTLTLIIKKKNKEFLVCQFLLCLDMISFPVLLANSNNILR